jgi:16S rRNA A1518/A1519 N6-dimethyltransferase RsmA/KsgA/DIM1 with predicted DNA glycosylase/AP lyase activity
MLKTSTKLITGKLTQIKDWPEIFEKCSIDPTQRPDQLSPENYIAIANLCSERLNQE